MAEDNITEKKDTVVTIVNSIYPPNVGITGESAHELASFLVLKKNIRVRIIHTDTQYLGGAVQVKPIGEIIKVKIGISRKNSMARLISGFTQSYLLIKKAGKYNDGPIIIMTDPPFLTLWAAILLKKKRWFHWSMDLYPEAFFAAKFVSKKNKLYQLYKHVISKSEPEMIISLGLLQLEYLTKQFKKKIPGIVLPCGLWENYKNKSLPEWKNTSKIIMGYCGNLGQAHSPEFLLEVINNLDEEKFTLILAMYGSKASEVLTYAEGKKGIVILKNVPRQQLEFIDIHLVSLQSTWNNICVPSKAVSAVCAGGALLFCGTKDNDNWQMLKDAAWFINEHKNIKAQVSEFFTNFTQDKLTFKKNKAEMIASDLLNQKRSSFEMIYKASVGC